MSTTGTPDYSVTFSMNDISNGDPSIADENFMNLINQAKQGGSGTTAYFDSITETNSIWQWLVDEGDNAWVPSWNTKNGYPVMLASNGNMQLRLAFDLNIDDSNSDTSSDDDGGSGSTTPVTGTAWMQTTNYTKNTSQAVTIALEIVDIVPTVIINKKLLKPFAEAYIFPLLKQFARIISKFAKYCWQGVSDLSAWVASATSGASPFADSEEFVNQTLAEESEQVLEEEVLLAGTEEAVKVSGKVVWGMASVGLGATVVLMAIPLTIELMAHTMTSNVAVTNMTSMDFNCTVDYQAHGKISSQPTSALIPKMGFVTDAEGDVSLKKTAYAGLYSFINSTDLSSIGYVLNVTPADGGDVARVMISVPWAGNNSIWVGASDSSGETVYDENSIAANQQLTTSYTFSNFQVTVTLDKLSGTTQGLYTYNSTIVIEPLS